MKCNGTTSKGTTRWRCKTCGASRTKQRSDISNAAVLTQFIEHCTTTTSLESLATRHGVSHATMKRRFTWCWLIDVPDPTIGHTGRIYDQIFLDGTYTASGCTIYQLALKLTGITTLDDAAKWGAQLHEFSTIYQAWMNEKTLVEDPITGRWASTWTHANVRKAYNSLCHLWRNNLLFVYLDPPEGILDAHSIKSTTNSLEGGINAQLEHLAKTHRGRSGEHQRRMLDWWLYLKTELPDNPVGIARQSNWGQNQLAKVLPLTRNENSANNETGRPALYDNAIDTNYTHSIGIQKGQI